MCRRFEPCRPSHLCGHTHADQTPLPALPRSPLPSAGQPPHRVRVRSFLALSPAARRAAASRRAKTTGTADRQCATRAALPQVRRGLCAGQTTMPAMRRRSLPLDRAGRRPLRVRPRAALSPSPIATPIATVPRARPSRPDPLAPAKRPRRRTYRSPRWRSASVLGSATQVLGRELPGRSLRQVRRRVRSMRRSSISWKASSGSRSE